MLRRALFVLLLASGCRYNPLLPDLRTPADFAKDVTPRCRGFTEESAAVLLSPSAIDSVEPALVHIQSGPSDREARLRGARIHVRPVPGASRESIARSLECHEARAVLGMAVARVDDPYALPGQWLDIDVDSEGDGFVVRVEPQGSYEVGVAREVLERAKRFAAANGAHGSHEGP
jgi:hypothetical protein